MTTSGDNLLRSLPVTAEFAECPPPPLPQQLHVLAVDDSSADRKVIEHLLKVSSCEVTAVESGTRALQFLGLDGEKSSDGFDGLKVNLIMTDYSMPGMNGYELLKKIKASSALRETPVVIMSSEKDFERIDRCLEEGAEDFIVKPVKLSDVKRLKDYVMIGKGEETRKNKTDSHSKVSIIRDESEENRKTATHKRKLRDDESLLSCSPQFPLSLLGCNPLSPLQPSSSPHHIPKQPRLCSSD